MEQIGITLLVLSLFAFLLSDDVFSHFWGGTFLSNGLTLLLVSYNETASNKISEELIILILLATNIVTIGGIYIFKFIEKKDKVGNF